MSLPFSYSGRIEIGSGNDVSSAASKLERGLVEMWMRRVERRGAEVLFETGSFRPIHASKKLSSISSGELLVQPADKGLEVLYRLRFNQLLLTVSIVVMILAPVFLIAPQLSIAWVLAILAATWIWFVVGNLIVGLRRFRQWVSTTIDAPHAHQTR
jgi:hypothetical protein